jgi:hypothetical protein
LQGDIRRAERPGDYVDVSFDAEESSCAKLIYLGARSSPRGARITPLILWSDATLDFRADLPYIFFVPPSPILTDETVAHKRPVALPTGLCL